MNSSFFPETFAFCSMFSSQSRMSTTVNAQNFFQNKSQSQTQAHTKRRAHPSYKSFILCGLCCIEELGYRQGQLSSLSTTLQAEGDPFLTFPLPDAAKEVKIIQTTPSLKDVSSSGDCCITCALHQGEKWWKTSYVTVYHDMP